MLLNGQEPIVAVPNDYVRKYHDWGTLYVLFTLHYPNGGAKRS